MHVEIMEEQNQAFSQYKTAIFNISFRILALASRLFNITDSTIPSTI